MEEKKFYNSAHSLQLHCIYSHRLCIIAAYFLITLSTVKHFIGPTCRDYRSNSISFPPCLHLPAPLIQPYSLAMSGSKFKMWGDYKDAPCQKWKPGADPAALASWKHTSPGEQSPIFKCNKKQLRKNARPASHVVGCELHILCGVSTVPTPYHCQWTSINLRQNPTIQETISLPLTNDCVRPCSTTRCWASRVLCCCSGRLTTDAAR